MEDANAITEVSPGSARCRGTAGAPHAAAEIAVGRDAVAVCPICGRRFRAADAPDRVGPAAWPRDE